MFVAQNVHMRPFLWQHILLGTAGHCAGVLPASSTLVGRGLLMISCFQVEFDSPHRLMASASDLYC